jgi:hypothetical protein
MASGSRREVVRTVVIVALVSSVPWLLFNAWFCYRADDVSRCIGSSVHIWTGVLLFILGAFGLRVVWAVITWASDLSSVPRLRAMKRIVLGLGVVLPLIAIAQAEMDYTTILGSVTSLWFIVMWFAVVYLSWAWASASPFNDIKTWFTIYAAVIVLMWLGSHGVFRDALDDSSSTDLPSALTDQERLLRNVVFYSLAGLAGVWATRWKKIGRGHQRAG